MDNGRVGGRREYTETGFGQAPTEDGLVLTETQHEAIAWLWARKLEQDDVGLPQAERHRNLEPESADFIHALALNLRATRLLEIGGSSGISTIALAAAARATGGRLTSIEIDRPRQDEARIRLTALGLADHVEFICADAGTVLATLPPMDFVLIDCEKDDYVTFFDRLALAPGAVVVADNILSHDLREYVAHARTRAPSVTLAIGKGLELTSMR
jgi:predicted O-methyltransferase YrrM